MKDFYVHLEHSANLAGHRLTGSVVVILTEPMEIQRITVSFIGRAYVYWEEEEQVEGRKGPERFRSVLVQRLLLNKLEFPRDYQNISYRFRGYI